MQWIAVQADGCKQDAAAEEWAAEVRDVFHDNLKEQQLQMGDRSWEFLQLMGIDTGRALEAAMVMVQTDPACPSLSAQKAQVAREVRSAIR